MDLCETVVQFSDLMVAEMNTWLLTCTFCFVDTTIFLWQSVPSWKQDKVSLVKASLEVVGQDGRPHSWRGKVRPVYESLSTLWATDQCLIMDPAAIGVFAGANIILHTKITVYVPGEK